jgi:4-amino-4-deoxy-L-arabinose transferase-like glycosyltransferase
MTATQTTTTTSTTSPRNTKAIVACAVVVYLVLSVGRMLTDAPTCDEGWFASPAHNLATRGAMTTTVIEEANLSMTTGIHTYTYWIMPLNVLMQAAWYKFFGFGLFTMRSISVLFGIVALLAWFSVIRSLTGDERLALLALVLIAVDFSFIRSSSNGRMDMMCAALNALALASYLKLRSTSFDAAIVVSSSFVAAAGLTHPNGLLGLMALLVFTLSFDRKRLRFKHLALASVPFAIGAACYAPYVLHNPRLFVTQLSGNGGGRLWGLSNPWAALKTEIAERYVGISSGANPLKTILTLIYGASIVLAVATREVRQQKCYRALLIIAALWFGYFTFFEGTKLYLYLVHPAPVYVTLLAAVIRTWWSRGRVFRLAAATAVIGAVAVGLAGSAFVMLRDSYHKNYLPAMSFLNQTVGADSLVFGTSELSFGLRNYDTLLDDKWLGYHTSRKADLIVLDSRYEQEQQAAAKREPEILQHVNHILSRGYRLVYDGKPYHIFAVE